MRRAKRVRARVLRSPQQRSLGNALSATLSRVVHTHVCVPRPDRVSVTRISTRPHTPPNGRLVPPRLRRETHLLTEYHRDSYITAVRRGARTHRQTEETAFKERCFAMHPELGSRALLFSVLPHSLSSFFLLSPLQYRADTVTAMAVS